MDRQRSVLEDIGDKHESVVREVRITPDLEVGISPDTLFRHVDQISQNSDVNVEKVRATKYLDTFDEELQCPSWGYPTVGAYYRDASSTDSLLAVRIPVLAVNAEDDPIAPKEVLPYTEAQANPYVVLCTTSMGGHLSWFESGDGRWFVKPVSRENKFLHAIYILTYD